MTDLERPPRRDSLEPELRRDLERHQRRMRQSNGFWQALRVLGMVGWPIALGSVGGAWLGSYLDARWGTRFSWTLTLLGLGLLIGCLAAWKAVQEQRD